MRLKRAFFNRDTNIVARELLGKRIVRVFDNGERVEGIITETEAYHGFDDKASHASRKKTERNKVMFEKAGLVYVYLIYGMYWCINVVTMPKNFPAAVLIRGIVVDNSKIKKQKLKILGVKSLKNLSKIEKYETENFTPIIGPGRVCMFLQIDKLFYGEDLTKSKRIWIESVEAENIKSNKYDIITSKRVGVDYAEECREWEWNYKIDIK